MTSPNRREEIEENAPFSFVIQKVKMEAGDKVKLMRLMDKTIHQELQKARESERERIKEIVVDQIYAGSKTKSEALHFIEKAIDQSELDQPDALTK